MKKNGVNIGLLILRLSLSLMMLVHGLGKMFGGLGGVKAMLEGIGMPTFFAYGVLVGEVLAPLLILIGYKTRAASLVLAFNMLVAIMMAHGATIFSLGATGGLAIELPALYLFGAVVLMFTGGGKYAVSTKGLLD